MFNKNDDQQSFNLRLNYSIQMREKNYVSSYELEHLEVYRYVSSTFVNLSIERRRSLTSSRRIYEHQYTYAKTQAFVNRLCNPYAKVVDETNMQIMRKSLLKGLLLVAELVLSLDRSSGRFASIYNAYKCSISKLQITR